MKQRTEAMVNSALIVLGLAAIIDNIVFHWILGWHRLIEDVSDPEMFLIELGVVFIGVLLFGIGLWRELQSR